MAVGLCSLWIGTSVWAADDLGRTQVAAPGTSMVVEPNKEGAGVLRASNTNASAQTADGHESHGAEQLFGSEALNMVIVKKPMEAIRYVTSSAVASANSVASVAASVASVASNKVLDVAGFIQQGIASWYGAELQNRRTANGERFNMNDLTAAHPTLPFGTKLCAHSPATGKSVIVRINDRGPFTKDRIIDFSRAAAQALGILHAKPDVVTLLESSDQRCAME